MKKSGLTFLILFISIFPTLAQQEYMGRKTAEQRTELITKNLAEKLHLSATQTDSVSEVILKREKFRDGGMLSAEKKKQTDAEIKQILTKEQQQHWMEMKKEAENRKKSMQNEHAKEETAPETD